MQIMTQDHKRLINSEYVSQFYIVEDDKGVKLMAATDVDVTLGSYSKPEHAEMALKFIGICLVDEDAQNKITQVPTREDMERSDDLIPSGLNPDGLKKLFERAMSSRGGAPENPDGDSVPDLFSLLKSILD